MICKYFLPDVSLSFHSLNILLQCKCFKFWWSPFVVLQMDHAFGVISKNSLPNPRSYRFFPVLSSKTFYTLCLTFIFIIQFRLLFNKVLFLSRDSFSFFCLLMFNYFNTYVERLSFLYLIAFSSLWKIS